MLGGSGQDAFYLASYLCKQKITVTWLHRSNTANRFKKLIDESLVYLLQVSNYCTTILSSDIDINKFDAVVLIAGIVGNQQARLKPINTYSTNMNILHAACSAIIKSNNKPHLYYFSTSDTDGSSSNIQPCIFNPRSTPPKTTYGLSKLHGSEYLQLLNNQGEINSTIVNLGMHESFCRSGDYVLSKIKAMIKAKILDQEVPTMMFDNLNIYLDIGFAKDYMTIVGQLILSRLNYREVVIGTGQYSHLYKLCDDILDQFQIDITLFLKSDSGNSKPIYYPLVPTSISGLPRSLICDVSVPLSSPPPLNGEMLKLELQSFADQWIKLL